MPIPFFNDTDQTGLKPVKDLCYSIITLFDGPAICKRPKGHKVDDMRKTHPPSFGEFHQEEYEGWVWDDKGRVR